MVPGVSDMGATLILNHLSTAPLKFRTLKLSGCTLDHSRLLVDACSPNLECVVLEWHYMGGSYPQGWGIYLFTLSQKRAGEMYSVQFPNPHQVTKARTQTCPPLKQGIRHDMVTRDALDHNLNRVHRIDHLHRPQFVGLI
jgi:hypothetical protein